MKKYSLKINGETHKVSVDDDTPILWVLRDTIGLTGTKFGCGRGLCGTCTIHVDGEATRSCVTAIDNLEDGAKITTIEGLSENTSHVLQKAWIEEEVPQCGYCQSGQIMTAASLLEKNNNPDDDDIDNAMKMNLCRCGTYQRIRKAIKKAAKEL